MTPSVNIALIDSSILFRKGFAQLITTIEGIKLAEERNELSELQKQHQKLAEKVDLIIIGTQLATQQELKDIQATIKAFPQANVMVISFQHSKETLLALLEMGVVAWLPKTAELAEIKKCLLEIAQKGFFYQEKVLEVVREHLSGQKSKQLKHAQVALSKRETMILQLICEQYTNTEIAQQLNISNRTVEWHRTNLLRKLQVRNTAGLVAKAILQHWVQLELPD